MTIRWPPTSCSRARARRRDDTPSGVIRRVLLIGGRSVAPNAFALGIDPGTETMVLHQLVTKGATDMVLAFTAAAIAMLICLIAAGIVIARDDLPAAVVGYTCHGLVSIKPDRSLGGGCMSMQHQTSRRENSTPGPERPSWLFLVTGGLVCAGALLGMWIVLAGQPDAQDLAGGSVAAVLAVSVGYLLSQRGKMVPSVRGADLRTLAAVPWQVVVETGQVFALAARKASGRPAAPGALRTVPLDAGPDVRGWPAARREAVLTALLSAAPNTVVVDIDMEAGTALVHQLAGAPQPDARPAGPG